jgi:hypothetical protein
LLVTLYLWRMALTFPVVLGRRGGWRGPLERCSASGSPARCRLPVSAWHSLSLSLARAVSRALSALLATAVPDVLAVFLPGPCCRSRLRCLRTPQPSSTQSPGLPATVATAYLPSSPCTTLWLSSARYLSFETALDPISSLSWSIQFCYYFFAFFLIVIHNILLSRVSLKWRFYIFRNTSS